MRAVLVKRPGPDARLDVVEVPQPEPGPDQVLIRTKYAAVNFADLKRSRGELAPGRTASDFVPGIEVAGQVAASGAGVAGLDAGTSVIALIDDGGYADYALATASATFVIPPGVSQVQAGALGVVACTAYLALAAFGSAAPGVGVAITSAAGGVGCAATQIAAELGLVPIIAAAGSLPRARGGLGRGATHGIDYSEGDLRTRLFEVTGNKGVDIVLDAVGGGVRRACVGALAPRGRLVHYGNSSGAQEVLPLPDQQREALISTVGFSLRRCRLLLPQLLTAAADTVLTWAAAGRLEMPVDRVLPLAEAAAAHRLLGSRQVVGKVLLEP